MTPSQLKERIRSWGEDLGFDLVGCADADPSGHMGLYGEWITKGRHGEMGYLSQGDALTRRGNLELTLEAVGSVVVVAHEYGTPDPPGVPDDPSRAVIARYARGDDYHEVMKGRLDQLLGRIQDAWGEPVTGRSYVDTGPILERELASRAGLGWFGKNTMLLHPKRGSYFFLGLLLLDVALPPDEPFAEDRCGTCRACLDACPTGALLGHDGNGAPVMDARRCISYLTIELKGPIPRELRSLMGNRVYGCDICQEVCPWNERFAEPSTEPAYSPRAGLDGPSLIELAERLLGMSGKGFRRGFSGSPVARAGRKGLLRNVCVALGNWGEEEAVPVLVSALADAAPLVRGHAAWALGRIDSSAAVGALSSSLLLEEDGGAREEISSGLGS